MSGAGRVFVDSNILLYAVDFRIPTKRDPALTWVTSLWSVSAGSISWQVLFEFYANAIRKLKVSTEEARAVVQVYQEWSPLAPNLQMMERAWYWCDQAEINFWDALILSAAEQAGCRWLLTEDFQAGRSYDSVTVINPFQSSPGEFGLA
jgi:predicted nucleic acid-binding protein